MIGAIRGPATPNGARAIALAAGLLGTVVVASSACRKTEATTTVPVESAAPSARAVASAPVDHLAPGELVEGSDRAFGVALPGGARVAETFVDVVYANGPFAIHPLVQYFAARVEGGSLHEGATVATFEHVHAPGRPEVDLQVHLSTTGGGARIEVRDATPHPAPALPDEAARWRQVGLTPQGRIADPTHLD